MAIIAQLPVCSNSKTFSDFTETFSLDLPSFSSRSGFGAGFFVRDSRGPSSGSLLILDGTLRSKREEEHCDFGHRSPGLGGIYAKQHNKSLCFFLKKKKSKLTFHRNVTSRNPMENQGVFFSIMGVTVSTSKAELPTNPSEQPWLYPPTFLCSTVCFEELNYGNICHGHAV